MAGIFDEQTMTQILGNVLPAGETLTARLGGGLPHHAEYRDAILSYLGSGQ